MDYYKTIIYTASSAHYNYGIMKYSCDASVAERHQIACQCIAWRHDSEVAELFFERVDCD